MSEGNIPSLIMIMQKVIATQLAPDKIIEATAVTPMNWCVFSQWQHSQEDGEIEFSFIAQVLWPDKSEFFRHSAPLIFAEKKKHNMVVNIMGFPVGKTGEVTVNIWLERASVRVGEIHSWSIEVEHNAGHGIQ